MVAALVQHKAFVPASAAATRPARRARLSCAASAAPQLEPSSRRAALQQAAGLAAGLLLSSSAKPALAIKGLPDDDEVKPTLCDPACVGDVAKAQRVSTPSGLEYVDIVKGNGASPPKGYSITVDYVAMTPEGRVFDSSLEKGYPYQIRVGAGQIVAGLDEGLLTMATGGVRRLYIPGNLAFPKGLPSAAGRPRVLPSSPVVFDVKLLYIPGISDDDADEE